MHEPDGACSGCGTQVGTGRLAGVEQRQAFHLPAAVVQVTEHQLVTRRCDCGTRVTGSALEWVGAPVQYGPRVVELIVYLRVGQFLSKTRTAPAMAELYIEVHNWQFGGRQSATKGGLVTGLNRWADDAGGVVLSGPGRSGDERGPRPRERHWQRRPATGPVSGRDSQWINSGRHPTGGGWP